MELSFPFDAIYLLDISFVALIIFVAALENVESRDDHASIFSDAH